jgi:hypothetical protein
VGVFAGFLIVLFLDLFIPLFGHLAGGFFGGLVAGFVVKAHRGRGALAGLARVSTTFFFY